MNWLGFILLGITFILMIIRINNLMNLAQIKNDQVRILLELLKLDVMNLITTEELNEEQKKEYIKQLIQEGKDTIKLLTKEVD
jgi:hypothetical protein